MHRWLDRRFSKSEVQNVILWVDHLAMESGTNAHTSRYDTVEACYGRLDSVGISVCVWDHVPHHSLFNNWLVAACKIVSSDLLAVWLRLLGPFTSVLVSVVLVRGGLNTNTAPSAVSGHAVVAGLSVIKILKAAQLMLPSNKFKHRLLFVFVSQGLRSCRRATLLGYRGHALSCCYLATPQECCQMIPCLDADVCVSDSESIPSYMHKNYSVWEDDQLHLAYSMVLLVPVALKDYSGMSLITAT